MTVTHRKRRIEIEARQWDGTESGAWPIVDWMRSKQQDAAWFDKERLERRVEGELSQMASPPKINIRTLEGVITASPGDWIIRGVQGEFYPCKPDIFELTYTAVEEPDGAELISLERRRQVEELGYVDDSRYSRMELTDAARCYLGAAWYSTAKHLPQPMPTWTRDSMAPWPWSDEAWKPEEEVIPNLVKAGALIAAEIDRLRGL